jgi:hypothetical protein
VALPDGLSNNVRHTCCFGVDVNKNTNMNLDFLKFSSRILDGIEFVEIPLGKIKLDDEAQKVVKVANPVAGLRARADFSQMNPRLINILLLQSPMICFSYRSNYKLIGGFFTYCKLCTIPHEALSADYIVRVTVIKKKPSAMNRRLFFLQDLTRALLTEGFTNESAQIKTYLESWFYKEPHRRSIYQSREWQTLFPKLKTMEDFANWLHISKKTLS